MTTENDIANRPFVPVDLSALPPPEVIETLLYREIRGECLEVFASLVPDYAIYLESDPVVKVIEAFAYREYKLRLRINAAAEALLIAKSTGADLDNMVADLNVIRLEGEDDVALRRRYLERVEAFSGAGPAGAYIFHAKTSDASIRDATAVHTTPGTVTVSIIVKEITEQSLQPQGYQPFVPTPATLNRVRAALNSEYNRPLTDSVVVRAGTIQNVPLTVTLVVYDGPDEETVRLRALASLLAFREADAYLGNGIQLSAIYAAAHVAGVYSASLNLDEDVPGDQGVMIRFHPLVVNIAEDDD